MGRLQVNYNSNKNNRISIKKENLTSLKSYSFYGEEAVYIFKSATNNTLANIFNPNQFPPDFTSYVSIGQVFFSVNFENIWVLDYSTNANNFVIPINSTLQFGTSTNLSISVGGGAIIQKNNSGKIILKKN